MSGEIIIQEAFKAKLSVHPPVLTSRNWTSNITIPPSAGKELDADWYYVETEKRENGKILRFIPSKFVSSFKKSNYGSYFRLQGLNVPAIPANPVRGLELKSIIVQDMKTNFKILQMDWPDS